ncbi:hypothetical protein ABK040_011580 [Willaertia magna]
MNRINKAEKYFSELPPEMKSLLQKTFQQQDKLLYANHKAINNNNNIPDPQHVEQLKEIEHDYTFCIGIPTAYRPRNYLLTTLHSIITNTSMNDIFPASKFTVNLLDVTHRNYINLNYSPHLREPITEIFPILNRNNLLNNLLNTLQNTLQKNLQQNQDNNLQNNNLSQEELINNLKKKIKMLELTNEQFNELSYHARQSLDYLTLLQYCHVKYPKVDYIIILEDDAIVGKGWLDNIREFINHLKNNIYNINKLKTDEDNYKSFYGKQWIWLKLFFVHQYNDYTLNRVPLLINCSLLISFILTCLFILWRSTNMSTSVTFKKEEKDENNIILESDKNLEDKKIVLNRFIIYLFAIFVFLIALFFLLLLRFHYLESKFVKLINFFEYKNNEQGLTTTNQKFYLQRNFPHFGSTVGIVYPNSEELLGPLMDYLSVEYEKSSSAYPNDLILFNYLQKNKEQFDTYLVIPNLVEHIGSVSTR